MLLGGQSLPHLHPREVLGAEVEEGEAAKDLGAGREELDLEAQDHEDPGHQVTALISGIGFKEEQQLREKTWFPLTGWST